MNGDVYEMGFGIANANPLETGLYLMQAAALHIMSKDFSFYT